MRKFLLFVLVAGSLYSKGQDIDILHYRFGIHISDRDDTVTAYTEVRFKRSVNTNILSLDLEAPGTSGKGMRAQMAILIDGEGKKLNLKQEEGRVLVELPRELANDTLSIKLFYRGVPNDGLIISKNKYGDRTFFADNWPNRAHRWLACRDQPDDKASFEFLVASPPHYSVISNGVKISENRTDEGLRVTHWKEDIPQPTKVMVIGVAKFATKTYDNSPANIPVSAWVYPQDSTKGFYDYALAPDILKFFSDYIAPFPYKKLANVQSKTIFGGMENASAIFYAESSVTGDRSSEDLLAHEIAHQWFGDMASEKSFAHLWLSEGFATFLTNYYWEKKYGIEAAAKRWKENRDEVIAFSKENSRSVVDSTSDLMSLLNANSYQKGAWVLRMLRNEVGDKTFQRIIQAYYNQYKGSNADTRDFEAVAEKVSGKELTWFFDQWLYTPGLPILEIRTALQNGEFILVVKQQGKPYRLSLEVDIVGKDSEIINHRFEISKNEETFIVPAKGSSAHFALDPDTKLLYKLKD